MINKEKLKWEIVAERNREYSVNIRTPFSNFQIIWIKTSHFSIKSCSYLFFLLSQDIAMHASKYFLRTVAWGMGEYFGVVNEGWRCSLFLYVDMFLGVFNDWLLYMNIFTTIILLLVFLCMYVCVYDCLVYCQKSCIPHAYHCLRCGMSKVNFFCF